MNIVITGEDKCMGRQYCDLCIKHGYKVKVFCKFKNGTRDRISKPDLMVLFTHTVSYKMAQCALNFAGENTCVVRLYTNSMSFPKGILVEHTV